MLVTPAKKSFGKYKPGDVFELRDKAAKAMIKLGKLAAAPSTPAAYLTRELRAGPAPIVDTPAPIAEAQGADAEEVVEEEVAPYGYKADGTPRKRPGRTPSEG